MNKIYVILLMLYFSFSYAGKEKDIHLVKSFTVKSEQIAKEQKFIGRIKANKQVNLSFLKQGTIKKIYKKSLDFVSEGEIIASLKNDAEEKSYEQSLKVLKIGEENLKRKEKLYESKDIAKSELEEAKRELADQKIKVLENLEKLNKTLIKASFSGTLGSFLLQEGEFIKEGQVLASLVSDSFSIIVNVPAPAASFVFVGQVAELKEAKLKGQVIDLDIVIDESTRSRRCVISFSSILECNSCVIGQDKQVILYSGSKSAIPVPKTAIFFKSQKPHVMKIIKEGDEIKVTQQEVILEDYFASKILVMDGLKDNDEIVLENPKFLSDNEKVKVAR